MLDINLFRTSPEFVIGALVNRGMDKASAEQLVGSICGKDKQRRVAQTSLQDLLAKRNAATRQISTAMSSGDREQAEVIKQDIARMKDEIRHLETVERETAAELEYLCATVPNVPLDDVPIGKDEHDNVELRLHGAKPEFGFSPKEHYEIGEKLGLLDFAAAGTIAGSRFSVTKGSLARLSRALGQFMLDLHTTEHGYTEVEPPLLVRDAAVFGTGQLPKFSEDLFRTTDGRWLVPTAEVPLTNLVRERILDDGVLPLRYTALTPCFRSEAGAAGRDVRGMLRQHQFSKVELVSIVREDEGEAELERITKCAEEVLKRLGLHFRTVVLCTGDMGFGARKTYDIEVWLPGQGAYREISSCSLCGDFQARRMDARYRKGGRVVHVHTLNGSGVAVGRALIAVMENYQNEDGSITVPEVLRPYMGGVGLIC